MQKCAIFSKSGLFAEHLSTVHALAKQFAELLRNRASFEVVIEPESNIVCFRHHPVQCDSRFPRRSRALNR